MPLLGTIEPTPALPLYFKSLNELDSTQSSRSNGIVKFVARNNIALSNSKGRLLACHDYKGGYTESSFDRSYTFNFWSTCDVFVYFSHHRVTVPPPGWISAAHKQGVKMLGTLIFEHAGSEEDCLRLLVGKLPNSKTGQVSSSETFTLPMSPHYATLLAELARDRGFDGYLLNFECPLAGSFEQTRALAAWITCLQAEILDKVGAHGETIWYDSVIVTGQLAWQDRLNYYNLPFFLSSTGFFANYTWRTPYPLLTAQYFTSIDASLLTNAASSTTQHLAKTLQDVYVGVDVWGRGTHGGGGFGTYKALEHINPGSLGLSVALFGQAWTWESEQDKKGWCWDAWWKYDSMLWTGLATGPLDIPLPESRQKKGEPPCEHGEFAPITSFFARQAPPDPATLPLYISFCPGTGLRWFVEGKQVYESSSGSGWTDLDKQTSIGDLLWPAPRLAWEDSSDRKEAPPRAESDFVFEDAWNGGSSVRIAISCTGSDDELAPYRALWMPIQTITISPCRSYQGTIIYKLDQLGLDGVDVEVGVALKPRGVDTELDPAAFVCDITSSDTQELANGWTKASVVFETSSTNPDSVPTSLLEIGLVLAIVTDAPTEPLKVSFLLGQLSVSAHLLARYTEAEPLIMWANFEPKSTGIPSPSPPRTSTSMSTPVASLPSSSNANPTGLLTWQVAATLPPVRGFPSSGPDPEDPNPMWDPQPGTRWFPEFAYFNVYAQALDDGDGDGTASVENATWIGTSSAGWEGRKDTFSVVGENLPFEIGAGQGGKGKGKEKAKGKVRFYVQGVDTKGGALRWARCAFVDVAL